MKINIELELASRRSGILLAIVLMTFYVIITSQGLTDLIYGIGVTVVIGLLLLFVMLRDSGDSFVVLDIDWNKLIDWTIKLIVLIIVVYVAIMFLGILLWLF